MADNGQGVSCTSSASNIVTVLRSTVPPAAPSFLHSALISDNDVELNWGDNSDNEEVFVLQRSIDDGDFTVLNDAIAANTVVYLDEDVAVPHTYHYRLLARNRYGDSDYSATTTIEVGPVVPTAPSDLQCSLTGGNDIQLAWTDNSTNEQYFVLERSTDGGQYSVLNETIAANTEIYTDQDVAAQHDYSYRVKARNINGDSDYSNIVIQNVPYTTYTLNLQSTTDIDDSFLWQGNPTENYGSDAWATADLYEGMRYIAKYNFPPVLTGKRILNANLYIYWWNQTGTWQPGLYMQLYQVTQSWEEASVTWNDASTGTPWTTAGGTYGKLVGQAEIGYVDHGYYNPADITDIVRRWVRGHVANNGFIMMNTNTFTSNIKASEYNPMSYLQVTYTDACTCDFPADFNYDCKVDLSDFYEMSVNWGMAGQFYDISPAGGDGIVDILDFQEMAQQWLLECL